MMKLTLVLLLAVFGAQAAIVSRDALPEIQPVSLVSGHFHFASQKNYLEYLQAINVEEKYRAIIAGTTPDVEVEHNGANGLILRYLSQYLKVEINLILDEVVEANLLGFESKQYYVTLENGDNLVAKEVDQPKASISGKFSTNNLILTLTAANGVTATRTFYRV